MYYWLLTQTETEPKCAILRTEQYELTSQVISFFKPKQNTNSVVFCPQLNDTDRTAAACR
jgi:hypothetical protein